FFCSSRRRHTRLVSDWSSDVCSSDLAAVRTEHRAPSLACGLAEFERELIRARTGEGRKRAKERGVRFGRPRKMTPHQRQEALQRSEERRGGEESRRRGVGRSRKRDWR